MNERLESNHEQADTASGFDSLKEVEFAGDGISFNQYLKDARRNLMAMSRTARGVVDTSASTDKAASMTGVSGEAAADLAQENFDAAILTAYENRDREFSSPEELRGFVEGLAERVNQGIVKEGNLIRTADSAKYPYARVANLENYMSRFYEGLYKRASDPNVDPVEAAAFAEFGIDFGGHFFADGCGKTAKVVSSFMLMRSGHELPEYKGGREAYYANQLAQVAGENEAADAAGYEKFLNYYRGLFSEDGASEAGATEVNMEQVA